MRELGFSDKWSKLNQPEFTTFRFPRKDKDWQMGEMVKCVFRPRSRAREVLFEAIIILKEPRSFSYKDSFTVPSNDEAQQDGFTDLDDMMRWLYRTYGKSGRFITEPMNRLTLRRGSYRIEFEKVEKP